jgi:hypothetical protein
MRTADVSHHADAPGLFVDADQRCCRCRLRWCARLQEDLMHTISRPRSLWQVVMDAWSGWRRCRADLSDLRRFDPAIDVGLDRSTLFTLAAKRPDSADLLIQRMKALGMAPETLGRREPAIMRDMQRCCSCCDSKARCSHDLDNRPQDSAWRTYCPNGQTLRSLQART